MYIKKCIYLYMVELKSLGNNGINQAKSLTRSCLVMDCCRLYIYQQAAPRLLLIAVPDSE